MSRFSLPALFLCSLAAGGALFFFSLRRLPASGGGGLEGYAALGLEEGVPDREAAAALEAALGRPVVSESSQWVFLNNFEGLERVPLEEYQARLEPLDPRRDGYAEKLMNFFVREGRRWFFIPLDGGLFGPLPVLNPGERLKKRIAAALDGVSASSAAASAPFSLLMKPRPPGFRTVLFALAWAAAFLFSPASRGESPRGGGFRRARGLFRGFPGGERRRLLFLGPLMLPLGLWGAPGFAFLALFLFLSSLLADPLKERWIRLLRRAGGRRAGPRRSRFLSGLFLVPLAALIPWIGGMPPLWISLNFLGLSLIYCCSLGLEIRRKFPPARGGAGGKGAFPYGSCRFVPLPILPSRRAGAFFPPAGGVRPAGGMGALPGRAGPSPKGPAGLVLPFAAASFLAVFLGGGPGPSPSAAWPSLVREEDYRAHALFQAGFAFRPLGSQGLEEPAAGYFRYTLGEDGLAAGALPVSLEIPEIPPFPLADLSGCLAAWGSGEPAAFRGISRRPALPLGDLLFPLLAFLLVLPALAGGGRGWKRAPAYYDKRMAA
jgi:hypothetical protein